MNPKLVIIVGIFALIMVLAGGSSEEDRKNRKGAKYKHIDDPLMRAITEYHDENKSIMGTAGKGNGLDDTGRKAKKRMPDYMYYNNQTNTNTRSRSSRDVPYNQRQVAPEDKTRNNYYPPPPLPKNNLRQPTDEYDYRQPRSDNHMYLRSGQRLAYRGDKVFFVDSHGNSKTLPDGTYRTASGLKLFVQDGKKVLASH